MVHTVSDLMALLTRMLYTGILAEVSGLGKEWKNKSFGT
jgi:hypothetical protein